MAIIETQNPNFEETTLKEQIVTTTEFSAKLTTTNKDTFQSETTQGNSPNGRVLEENSNNEETQNNIEITEELETTTIIDAARFETTEEKSIIETDEGSNTSKNIKTETNTQIIEIKNEESSKNPIEITEKALNKENLENIKSEQTTTESSTTTNDSDSSVEVPEHNVDHEETPVGPQIENETTLNIFITTTANSLITEENILTTNSGLNFNNDLEKSTLQVILLKKKLIAISRKKL